ncbi:MAG: FAD-dependent oxidoreductase [Clostridia bacterium]|nr:FAD-dependent oxidoreductase [Clostridia bacterium]
MTAYDVLIIGAGASGLAAAAAASERGLKTALLERNDAPGRKIRATGNGRCNYSNVDAPRSAVVVERLRQLAGIEPAVEEGRIYPRSFEAATVAEALANAASGADLILNARAVSAEKNGGVFTVKTEDGRAFVSRALILACGGKAGIQYGCYGDGYKLAKAFGHSVERPIPALDAMVCAEDLEALHGIRALAKATLSMESGISCGGEFCSIYASGNAGADSRERPELPVSEEGEVQFTRNGISGICVMDLSRYLRLQAGTVYILSLDFFPEKTAEELEKMLTERRRTFGTGLKGLVPEKLAEYIEEPGKGRSAKDLSFIVTGTRGWKTAQVTRGGVPLSEVDPETFESVLCKGLYITGELLDYDGPCGGFNLNWAFLTGLAAGGNAGKED